MSDDCASSLARVVENIPLVGHLVALCHLCAKKPAHAERAGIKATIGLALCACNCPAELVDELARKISPKLHSYALTSRPEWMKRYHQHTLRQICLPGSHQSTSYRLERKLSSLPMASGWAACQQLTLAAQLDGGIRFFDLRLTSDDRGDIWTHHNVMTCVSLKEILDTVRSFINNHPTEIVGLYMTNDGKNIDWAVCTSLVNEYIGDILVYEHMSDMLIGDIVDQGKHVFISGIPNVAFSWKNVQAHWPNKQWPDDLHDDLENMFVEFSETGPQSYFWYKAECTPGSQMIVRSLGGVPGVAAHRCADEKFEFVEDMAAASNYVIYEILNQADRLPFNVLSTDFVQDEIVDRIIELNEKSSEHDETIVLSSSTNNLLDCTPAQSSTSFGVPDKSPDYPDPSARMKTSNALLIPDPQVNFIPPRRYRSRQDTAVFVAQRTGGPPKGDTSLSSARSFTASSRSSWSRADERRTRVTSLRSSHNTTSSSIMTGSFEMPPRKAPPVEVRETNM